MLQFVIKHPCLHCGNIISAESEGTRLAPKSISDKDLVKIPGRFLGQWTHKGQCFYDYMKSLK